MTNRGNQGFETRHLVVQCFECDQYFDHERADDCGYMMDDGYGSWMMPGIRCPHCGYCSNHAGISCACGRYFYFRDKWRTGGNTLIDPGRVCGGCGCELLEDGHVNFDRIRNARRTEVQIMLFASGPNFLRNRAEEFFGRK